MTITLLQAGVLAMLPVITPSTLSPRQPCQLERLTYRSADDRAVDRFLAAADDYVAGWGHDGIFNEEAARLFRFRLRVGRWLHRYQATEALDAGPARTRRHGASGAPGVVAAALPELPGALEYRMAGAHLLLVDRRTNTVVDLLPDAFADGWGR